MADRRWPIIAIFILSGAAGLVYEVVWARQLVLVFGNTTQAVSAILTGFFGGMAIGNVVGGRLADRTERTLRLYGWMELAIVVVVLVTPVTFRLLHEVYRGAFTSLEAAPGLLVLVRFTLALLALGPATILMGATLPTLTRHLSRDTAHPSTAFGRLYAANTFGAILGAAVAGFVLIELLGLTGSLVAGAACSATAGIAALWLDRARRRIAAPIHQPTPITGDRAMPSGRPKPRLAIAVAFVSGLTALGYQVLWTRLLATGTGNSTYVFTFILVVFLIGLTLGAAAFNLVRRRVREPVNILALAQVVVAVLAVIGVVAVIDRPQNVLSPYGAIDALIGRLSLSVVLVVLPATFVMGLSLPVASSLLAGEAGRVGEGTGSLLAANTGGAIAATILIPFVVIPLIGSPHAVAVLALVNAAAGIVIAFHGGVRERFARRMTGGIGIVVSVAIVVTITTGLLTDAGVARVKAMQGTVFASAEDDIASVQAGEIDGFAQLWVTGTAMTALSVDMRLMPVLSLALRPESETALVVAFGMGSAYRSALIAGLVTDAVELVPSVPSMFHWYFDDAERFLSDPRGHVIIADGRNHVELTQSRYDIIVVDPPPPIESSGVSVISSLEFYQAAHLRLNPGGVMMQWVPISQTVDEFKAHLRSYQAAFPHVLVARGLSGSGFFMFGSDAALAFDETGIGRVLERPGVTEDISAPLDAPAQTTNEWLREIPTLAWLSDERLARFAGDGPLVTDDHPLPEYFLLRHLFGSPSPMMSPLIAAAAAAAP